MAKRFIETGIFRKTLVRGLKAPYKAFFIYYITECDHAGVWATTNLDIDSILMGEELTVDGIKAAFGEELIFIDGKVFMPSFVKYQYGTELNPDNRVHNSVINRLKSIGIDYETLLPFKGLTRPSQGCKDKDIDIDIDKDKDRPTEKEFILYLVSKLPAINPDWTTERATRAAKSRYETYVANNWRDGYNKPVKNWKTKAINAIKCEKPWSYGSDDKSTPQSFTEINGKAKKEQFAKNIQNPLF